MTRIKDLPEFPSLDSVSWVAVDSDSDAEESGKTSITSILDYMQSNLPFVQSVGQSTGITVDNTDPNNPLVGLSQPTQDAIELAGTAVQPESLGVLAFEDQVTVGQIDATGTPNNTSVLFGDGVWRVLPGGGNMLSAIYDPQNISNDAFDLANHTGEVPPSSVNELGLTRRLSARVGGMFDTVADLIADTKLTYSNVSPGDIIEAKGFRYEVAASDATDHHLTTAGGVKLYVLTGQDGYREASSFGSDNTAWQTAVSVGGKLRFTGTFAITNSLSITSDIDLDLTDASFTASGATAAVDVFFCNDATISIKARGGVFSEARWGFAIRKALNVDIEGAEFDDMAVGIGVNVITNSTFSSAGKFSVRHCVFNDMEIGASVQSCRFAVVEFLNNKCTELADKSVADRVYPLDKKIVSGFWYQSLTGDTFALVSGNYVDGVTEPASPPAEVEVHGVAVTVDNGSETDVIMSDNHVRNVNGTSVEGVEGIMGRGKRVIITSSIAYNAGSREGAIYAKGSTYHKIDGCTIEVSSDYAAQASSRGVISTGSNCDVTNCKFVGLQDGIYTRALSGKFSGNQFINCVAPITLALETGATHTSTMILDNIADKDCSTFFAHVNTGAGSVGEIILKGNSYNGSGRFYLVRSCSSISVISNTIRRTPGSIRDLFEHTELAGLVVLKNNTVLTYQNTGGDARLLTGNTSRTPRIVATGNYFEGGAAGFWLRDQTYEDLVIKDNEFFDIANVLNTTSMTVTGKDVRQDNVGVDI